MLSINCAGVLLAQFISLVVGPGGLGDPGPIRYHLAVHWLAHDEQRSCIDGCPYPRMTAVGDGRPDPTGRHADAEKERRISARARRGPLVHLVRIADDMILGSRSRLRRAATGWLHRAAAADSTDAAA